MSGILAVFFGQADANDEAWQPMRADLQAVWPGGFGAWHDGAARLARAWCKDARGDPATAGHGHAHAGGLVEHQGCVVALDGYLFAGGGERADARAIVEAYRRWGDACVGRLEGELAFVLWDRGAQEVVAGCDASGARTLAYARDGERLSLSTRALALLRRGGSTRRIDPSYTAHVLCDAWTLAPGATAFVGVRRLRAGHVLRASRGRMVERRVAGIAPAKAPGGGSAAEWNGALVGALDDAVDARARDERCAITLSGGLDSSSVAASFARRGAPLDAYAFVSSARRDRDEASLVGALAARYPSLRVHELPCDGDDAFDPDPSRPSFDDPIVVGGALLRPLARALSLARDAGITRVFDGEGGDELFHMSSVLSDLMAPRTWRRLREVTGGWRLFAGSVWRNAIVPQMPAPLRKAWHERTVRRWRLTPAWLTSEYAAEETVRAALRSPWEAAIARYEDRVVFILDRPWAAGTRAAMRVLRAAHGVSGGAPLLDTRVIAVTMGAPPELRFDARHRKPFLRDAMRDRLPPEVALRPKDDRLYSDYVRRSLLAPRTSERLVAGLRACPPLAGAVDASRVARVLALLASGAPGDATTLWRLTSLLGFVDWYAAVDRAYGLG